MPQAVPVRGADGKPVATAAFRVSREVVLLGRRVLLLAVAGSDPRGLAQQRRQMTRRQMAGDRHIAGRMPRPSRRSGEGGPGAASRTAALSRALSRLDPDRLIGGALSTNPSGGRTIRAVLPNSADK
jgi:hypothetical protein